MERCIHLPCTLIPLDCYTLSLWVYCTQCTCNVLITTRTYNEHLSYNVYFSIVLSQIIKQNDHRRVIHMFSAGSFPVGVILLVLCYGQVQQYSYVLPQSVTQETILQCASYTCCSVHVFTGTYIHGRVRYKYTVE